MKTSKAIKTKSASARRSWRPLLALILLVLAPIVVIAMLSIRMAITEQDVLKMQFRSLVDAKLQSVDQTLQGLLSERATALNQTAENLNLETNELRDWLRQQPLIAQVFVMDDNGERLHPPTDADLNSEESRFMERSRQIWENKDVLYQARVQAESPASSWFSQNEYQNTSPSAEVASIAADSPAEPISGWYVWHWGTDTHLVYWIKHDNQLLGFEFEPARLMADIISVLPDANEAEKTLGNAAIALNDAQGSSVYTWGAPIPDGAAALAVLPLSPPMGSWRLEYFDTLNVGGGNLSRTLFLSLLTTLAAMGILAWYLYREHGRELREAGQRVNFVNRVSHELKTPLTNIRMYAEMLDDKIEEENEPERRYLNIIVSESQRLSRLIGNVLTFSQTSNDSIQPRWREGQIDEVIRTCVETFKPSLAARNIPVTISGQASKTVLMSADLIEQIMNNLLSNAEKYAPNAPLNISIAQHDKRTSVCVQDGGPGIPARERERVFTAFYRLDGVLNEGANGTGIGLGIARDLARAHGGDLRLIESDNGACFELILGEGKP